jgi:hypothetical protein
VQAKSAFSPAQKKVTTQRVGKILLEMEFLPLNFYLLQKKFVSYVVYVQENFMKLLQRTLLLVFSLFLITGSLLASEPIAVVLFSKGKVLVNKNTRVKMGDKISELDQITTGPKSSCELQLLNTKSPVVVRVKENTEFSMTKDEKQKAINSVVQTGKALFNVDKLSKGDKLNVVTPTSVAGVRGTKFEVSVEKTTGLNRIVTAEGEVVSRPRISDLESLDPQILKDNQVLSKGIQTISGKNTSIKGGAYSVLSSEETEKLLKESGLYAVMGEEDEEKFREKLDAVFKDKNFVQKFEASTKNGIPIFLGSLDSDIVDKRMETFDELIPVKLDNIDNGEEFLEALVDRNKERQYVLLINRLKRELRYALAKNVEYESRLSKLESDRTLEKQKYEASIQNLDTSITNLKKQVDESRQVTEQDKQIQKDIIKHLDTLKTIEETLKQITEKVK